MGEKNKFWKNSIIILGMTLAQLFIGAMNVHAAENRDIAEFIGVYLCDTPEMEESANPDVIELYFNDSGNLMRYSGLFYATTGTTVCYEYTNFDINGDTLTCYYDGAFSPTYGPRDDISAGVHEYVMGDDGSLSTEEHIWYPYLTDEEKQAHARTLLNVEDADFLEKNYSETASFLGIQELRRTDIEEINFLETLESRPENAWDVSQDQDGSVYAWLDTSNERNCLYIAGEGGIIANIKSGDLFRACTNLKQINFNNCFDTGNVESMEYMFADCRSLEQINGIESLTTDSVETMEGMFWGCTQLTQIDISSWNTENSWNFNKMFYGCSSLPYINVDSLNLVEYADYEDIFAGTVREGDCPTLSEERNKKVIAAYILDTEGVAIADSSLRAKVVNSYDDVLKSLDEASWKDAGRIMYALEDINGDGIPEMIIKEIGNEYYTYYAYTYNERLERVKRVDGFDTYSTGSDIYFYEDGYMLACYQDENYHLYSWTGEQFTENSVVSVSELLDMKGDKALSFRYVRPELIKMATIESSIESEKTYDLTIYGEKGNYGYVSASLYIDNALVLTKEVEDSSSQQVDFSGHIMTDDTIWLWMRIYTDTVDDYCGIIRYQDGTGKEVMNLFDAVSELQLVPYSGHNYFELKAPEDTVGDISLQFCVNTISYGSDFSFSMDYQYTDGELKQNEYLRDIENISEETFTLSKDKDIFENIASGKVKYTAKSGTKLQPDKMWIANGIIWIHVKNEDGESGWVPMGADTDYLELSYSYSGDVKTRIDENKDNNIYFQDSVIPDGDILYHLGELSYQNGEYEDAIIYCSLIKVLNKNYFDAQTLIEQSTENFQKELLEEIEENIQEENYNDAYKILLMQNEFLAETEKYQEYLELCQGYLGLGESTDVEENVAVSEIEVEDAKNSLLQKLQNMNLDEEHPLAYCAIDLDFDGIQEIISRCSTPEATEGGAYVYKIFKYDSESGLFKYLNKADFSSWAFDEAVYFWEDMGALVSDWSTGGYEFEVDSLEDGKLKTEYNTSSDLSYLPSLEFEALGIASAEEQNAYRNYLFNGKHLEKVQQLENVSYTIYDLNEDNVCELILKGEKENQEYQYWGYTYKDGEVKELDSFNSSMSEQDMDSLAAIPFYLLPWRQKEMGQNLTNSYESEENSDSADENEISGTYYFVYRKNDFGTYDSFDEGYFVVKDNQDGSITCLHNVGDQLVENFTAYKQDDGKYGYVSNALYEGYVSEFSVRDGTFIQYGQEDGNAYFCKNGDESLLNFTQTMQVVNCTEYVSLRDEPSTTRNAIATIPLGERVEAEFDTYGDFYKVTYNGMTGFVLKDYLSPVE